MNKTFIFASPQLYRNSFYSYTVIPHFITLHRYCSFLFLFFLQMEGFCQPCIEQVCCCFSNSICSLCVSVANFNNSYLISDFYYYICYGDLWSVIFDITITQGL